MEPADGAPIIRDILDYMNDSAILTEGSSRFISAEDFETVIKSYEQQFEDRLPSSYRQSFNQQQDFLRILNKNQTARASDLFDAQTRQPNQRGIEFFDALRNGTQENFQRLQAQIQQDEQAKLAARGGGGGVTNARRVVATNGTRRYLEAMIDDPHNVNPAGAAAARQLLEVYNNVQVRSVPTARADEIEEAQAQAAQAREQAAQTGDPQDVAAAQAATQSAGDQSFFDDVKDFGRIGLRSFLGNNILSSGVDILAGAQQVAGSEDGFFIRAQEAIDGVEQAAEGEIGIERDSFAYDLAHGFGFMASLMFGGPLAIAGKFTAKGASRLGALGVTESATAAGIAGSGAQTFARRYALATGAFAGGASQTLDYLETARANGLELEGDKYAAAGVSGSLLGLAEGLVPRSIFGRFGGTNGGVTIGNVLSGAVRAGAGEAVQEVAAGIASEGIAQQIYDPDRDLFDFERSTREGTVGGTIGAITSVAADTARFALGRRARLDQQREERELRQAEGDDARQRGIDDAQGTDNGQADPVQDEARNAQRNAQRIAGTPVDENLSPLTPPGAGSPAATTGGVVRAPAEADLPAIVGFTGSSRQLVERIARNMPGSATAVPEADRIVVRLKDRIESMSTEEGQRIVSLLDSPSFWESDDPALGIPRRSAELISREVRNAAQNDADVVDAALVGIQKAIAIDGRDNHDTYLQRMYDVIAAAEKTPNTSTLFAFGTASSADVINPGGLADPNDTVDPNEALDRRRLPEANPSAFDINVASGRDAIQAYRARAGDATFHAEQIRNNGLPENLSGTQQRAVDVITRRASTQFERNGIQGAIRAIRQGAGAMALKNNSQAVNALKRYADQMSSSLADSRRFTSDEQVQNTQDRESAISQRELERSELAQDRLRANWFGAFGGPRTESGPTIRGTAAGTPARFAGVDTQPLDQRVSGARLTDTRDRTVQPAELIDPRDVPVEASAKSMPLISRTVTLAPNAKNFNDQPVDRRLDGNVRDLSEWTEQDLLRSPVDDTEQGDVFPDGSRSRFGNETVDVPLGGGRGSYVLNQESQRRRNDSCKGGN